MKLSRPFGPYNARLVANNQFTIEQADAQNHKKEQDIEVGSANLILTSPNGSRYKVTVDNSGNLSASAI